MQGPSFGPPQNLPPAYLAEDNSSPLLATCIFFLILNSIMVFLMYTSRFLGKDQQANFWMTILMTAGYMVCIAKISLGILMIQVGGAGRHMVSLQPDTLTEMLKLNTALQIICPLTTSLTKLGILCLYQQIFARQSSRYYHWAIKGTFALVLCTLIIQVIIPFANCKPFSHSWDPFGPGSCAFPGLNLWRYLSIPNVISTIIMIAIPLPALYKLNVGVPTKLGLGVVFSVCIMGMVAAIMRFNAFLSVVDFRDITFECITPLCWTIAESGIYLMAGVLATLRPLIRKLFAGIEFDKILSKSFGKTSMSWGNKRGSRMLWGKPLPPVPKKGTLDSDVNEADDIEAGKGFKKQGRPDPRDTVFSSQEQSVIVMLEQNSDFKG